MKIKPDTSKPTLNDDDSYMESEVDRLALILMILVGCITFFTLTAFLLIIFKQH